MQTNAFPFVIINYYLRILTVLSFYYAMDPAMEMEKLNELAFCIQNFVKFKHLKVTIVNINTGFSILESNSAQDKRLVWSYLVGHILAFTSACTGGLFSICRGTTRV